GATTKDLTSLNAGTFSVTIKDALGCTFTQNNIVISQLPSTLTAAYAVINERCGGSNGSINLNVSGGNAPYTFLWNNGSTAEDLLNISAGSYSVKIKDASGCEKDFTNISLTNTTSNVAINLGADRNLCPGENIVLNPGSFTSYLWQDNSTAATFRVSGAGTYYVTVKDAFGCSGSDTIKIVASTFCNVYFPAAFTPDGDNLNDNFGLLGDITSVKNYELTIYGRWGQKVFHTKNPSEKWDGTYKGKKLSSQTFVWMASFTIGSRLPQLEKGTITLIR
ncbi:MAG: gliding motility-associated C-terminal domain-containing protein, partial [Bacteroidetes bacterium]|nr:gliding motility-associated C-terminal domain-containing protein [Bacteroidota bacterium]